MHAYSDFDGRFHLPQFLAETFRDGSDGKLCGRVEMGSRTVDHTMSRHAAEERGNRLVRLLSHIPYSLATMSHYRKYYYPAILVFGYVLSILIYT